MSRSRNHQKPRGHNWPRFMRKIARKRIRAAERAAELKSKFDEWVPSKLRDVLRGWWD